MKCVICKHGETEAGNITVTLEQDGVTLVVKGVPAEICENCGEEYVSSQVTASLLEKIKTSAQSGAHLDIREYKAA
jgi:YgiT-type zinc finger domain-containing protein